MASVGYDGTANSTWQLIRQWVLGPIGAQTFASQTIEMQIRADDNGSGTRLLGLTIRVVSADGSTVRGTIVGSPVEDGTNISSYQNRRITAVSTSVVAEVGDYIVIEVGAHRDGGSSSNSGLEYEIRIGDNGGGDLPEDDTTTTDLNPWVEFPNDINFSLSTDPEISDVDPDTFADGDTGIDITGTNFGASQGSGVVLLSPTDDVDDIAAVEQTVTAWGDTTITFTVVDTDLDTGTVYVFVVNDDAASNASGFAVSLYHDYSASLAGSLTPSGAVVRSASKVATGVLTPAGAASKAASKPVAGSVTPAGALASTLAHLVLLAGSLTPSGAVVRAVSKVLAGVLTPAGAASKAASKPLAGSVTPSGALVRAVSKSLAGSLGLAGAVSKAASKVLAGSVTPSGAATYLKQVFVSFTGAITPAGAVVRSVSKGLVGSVAGAGGLVRSASKVLGGSVSGAGALSRSASKVTAGSVSPAGAASKSTTKAAVGSVTGSGGLENTTSKGLAGSVSGAGSVSKSVYRGFAGSVAASGSLVKTAVKSGIAGLVTGAGGMVRVTTKGLTSSVAGVGEVSLTPRVVIRRILMMAWDRARLLVSGGDRARVAPEDAAGDRERFDGDAGE